MTRRCPLGALTALTMGLCACPSPPPLVPAPQDVGSWGFVYPDSGAADTSTGVAVDASAAGPDASGWTAPDAGDEGPLPNPALLAIDPPSGGCTVASDVLLRGQGFRQVEKVEVGGVAAADVVRLDSHTVHARFPAVDLTARGKKTVTLTFTDQSAVELKDGFEYLFDEDPVVFVHGYMLSPFDLLIQRFKDVGYPDDMLFRVDFTDVYGSSVPNADELAAFVAEVRARTGAPRVDLVVHSMGGLSSRLYIHQGGDEFVRDYVGIAGAFHGTVMAYLSWTDGAAEMRPPYACEGESQNDLQFRLNGCLTDSGRTFFVDETPFGIEEGGPISYLSISSEEDEFIIPSDSACLNQAKKGDCSDAANVRVKFLGHGTILLDENVAQTTIAHLRKRNRSKP